MFFSIFVVSYTYITPSFKETTIPLDESYNVIIAEEIFEQGLFNVAEDKTSHIHITRPFWQTEVTEIWQSWNSENYFRSICVETDSFSTDYLLKELLRFIKKHGFDFFAEIYSVILLAISLMGMAISIVYINLQFL